MTANYHTHTPRCRHAVGNEKEYIEFAVQRGLKILGFSDHSPQLFENAYRSSYRMQPYEVQDYCETIEKLKCEYSDRLTVFSGFEAEYYPKLFKGLQNLIREYSPDYMILGQHYINNEYDGVYSGIPTDDERVLERYVDQTSEALQTGYFTYFAHPDLINFKGSQSVYERHMLRLCENAKKENIPLEINALGLITKRNYPNEDFWKIASGVGCDAVIGCDAHEPCAVADPESVKAVYDFAEKHKLNVLEKVNLKKPI